jgi:hypothetical protein
MGVFGEEMQGEGSRFVFGKRGLVWVDGACARRGWFGILCNLYVDRGSFRTV